jgi:hypothetical protein
MKVNKRVVYVMLFSALLVMSLNCREEVPIREMSSAKVAITDAQSVQADRYAPDEIKAARTKLMEANAAIANSKTDDAQSAANASYKKAVEAYNKAVPLLAKDAIGSAEKSVESATEAYAEVLAKSSSPRRNPTSSRQTSCLKTSNTISPTRKRERRTGRPARRATRRSATRACFPTASRTST